MREIDDRHLVAVDDAVQLTRFLVRHFQEFLKQTELMHQLERGRMNRVAAEIAVKIGVLFQHCDFHPGARQQITGHHSRRAATDDDATCANFRVSGQGEGEAEVSSNRRRGIPRLSKIVRVASDLLSV